MDSGLFFLHMYFRERALTRGYGVDGKMRGEEHLKDLVLVH